MKPRGVHRSGLLKQQNKLHNTGRHRSKGQLDAKKKGRTANILSVRKHGKPISKKDRRNKRKQLRSLKREQANERKGTGIHLRPPVVVCILSLSRSIDPKDILSRLVQSRYKDSVVESERGLTFLRLPERRSRFCFLCPDAINMVDVLDSLKGLAFLLPMSECVLCDLQVAELVLFVWNGQDYELSDYFLPLLSSILAQGLPSFFNVLINPFEKNVKYEQEKRCLTAMAEKWGLKGRFYKLDTVKEQDALLRLMSSCSTKPLSLQEHRTRLLVESCTIAESNSETGLCTLRLCGYVRGPSLDVNRLVHIPGWGDYQLTSVDVLLDPHPLHEFQQFTINGFPNFAVASPECQEKLYSEIVMEQTTLEEAAPITEAELQLEGDFMQHPKHLFPKGTSEYQATWMMDLQECAENTLESENVVTISTDGTNDEACNLEVGSASSENDVEMLDYEETDTGSGPCEQSAAADWLARVREEREDKLFPDEIDTPAHEPARIRFQKYRSLKSFRTSFWDPKENLPRDYVRIVHFKNFSVTKKRILEQEVKGAVDGWYVAVYVKGVKIECAEFLCNFSHPLVVYSLLPNEQKMALLNVLLRKHSLCDQPIRSKDELLFQIGYRRYFVSPVFSQHTIADKHKVERFLPENATVVASFFAPVMFPPAGVSVFKLGTNGQLSLVGTGSLMNVDADRVILKRVVLSGHPYKINRRHAVVRYMFFNRDDVEWFRPVELRTRSGRRGYIREPIGTHGYMKCSFNAQLPSQDVVFIDLYKRVFPKWTYDPLVDQRLFAETCSKMDTRARSLDSLMDITMESSISRISRSPFHVEITPSMNYELKNVIQCDIAQVKQVLLEFASGCLEIRNLIVECREVYLPALCVYNAEIQLCSEKRTETEIVRSVGHLLPLLKDLLRFVRRCDAAIHRLISLMHKVYYEELPSKWKTNHLHLPTVFNFLAEILASLVSLDMAIQMHGSLKDDWRIYSRFTKTICKSDVATEAEAARMKTVEKILKTIDEELFKGCIFKNCAAKKNAESTIRVNEKLLRQFSSMTRTYALKADNAYSYECDMERHIMCACALLSFGHLYFRRIDKKLVRFFWKRYSKISAFTFCCKIRWHACEFLCHTLPDIGGIVDTSSVLNVPSECNIDVPFSSQMFDLSHHEFVSLEVTINSACSPESVLRQSPRKFTSILFRVLQLSTEVKHESQRVISNWLKSTSMVEKSSLEKCVRCLKAVKAIQRCLMKNQRYCADFLFRSMQRLSTLLLKTLVAVRPSLMCDRRYRTVVDNMLDALNAGLHVLSRPVTVESWVVLNLAFSFGLGEIVPTDQMKIINELMDQMSFIVNYRENFSQCFDFSFLIYVPWWKLNDSLTSHLEKRCDCSHSETLFSALNDHLSHSAAVALEWRNSDLMPNLELRMLNCLSQNRLVALADAVENNLRFSLFGNSQQETLVSAKERLICIHMLRQLPFRVGARVVNIREFVRRRLDENFYNLSTVASYDWQSYAEMRHLSKYELQVPMSVPNLPCCNQELDLISILRQFQTFVDAYAYNLDDQYFVEKIRKSKYQNIFGLQRALQSMKTHGLGALSTIMNIAYKFLTNKLRICLEHMLSRSFKSKLAKEMRFIQNLPSGSTRTYPYDRAEALERNFKSSTDTDGQTDLDRLRIFLTEIGNALGYLRLIRSAGLNMCFESLRLLPNHKVDFVQCSCSEAMNPTYGLWRDVASRTAEWQQGILKHQDCFKLLIKTFATEFRGDDFPAAQNFYSVIPALTLNFANHCLVYKESVQHYYENGLSFTDDGFAVGVAFLLNILGQFDQFTSLRWFTSVSSKISGDKQSLMKELLGTADKTLQQTVSFRIRQKEEFEQELVKVSDALASSRMFFHADMTYELVPSNSLNLKFTEDT